jgi:ABC-type transporter Mla MlaB component
MSGLDSTLHGLPPACPLCGAVYKVEPADPRATAPCTVCGHHVWFVWTEGPDEAILEIINNQMPPNIIGGLVRLLKARKPKRLVFDLHRVHQVTSDTLAELISLRKQMIKDQGDLVLRRLHKDFREVFRMLRLDQILTIEE